MSQKLEDMELYAWMGEDENGSGEVGLKQGVVPAGLIPLVAIGQHKHKMEALRHQMEMQAATFGKRIRLVRFTFAEVIDETVKGT